MSTGLLNPSRWFFWFVAISLFFPSSYVAFPIFAAEKTEKQESVDTKDSFNLILPYKDVTVGQGQDVTMDTEVVNRTKNPVRVGLSIEGVPSGWEVSFH